MVGGFLASILLLSWVTSTVALPAAASYTAPATATAPALGAVSTPS